MSEPDHAFPLNRVFPNTKPANTSTTTNSNTFISGLCFLLYGFLIHGPSNKAHKLLGASAFKPHTHLLPRVPAILTNSMCWTLHELISSVPSQKLTLSLQ